MRGRVRHKLQKIEAFADAYHALLPAEDRRGRWRACLGRPDAQLVLELGCGQGTFGVQMAQRRPEAILLGMDHKAERLWQASRMTQELGVDNAWWLHAFGENLDELFAPAELDELWLTFPDPYPKARHARRRLLAPSFLAQYARLLKPEGRLHLKTDSQGLFAFVHGLIGPCHLKVLAMTTDLYHSPWLDSITGIATDFERKFLAKGMRIHYLCLGLDHFAMPEPMPDLGALARDIYEMEQARIAARA